MTVKIGIIDNDISLKIAEKKNIDGDKLWSKYHGNICSLIIQHYVDDVELINKKVFKSGLTAKKRNLIKTLKDCVERDVDIVNLSLGSTYPKDFRALSEISRMLRIKGIIVIAAISNSNQVTMPAFSENTIGVGCDDRLRGSQYYCVDERLGLFFGNGIHRINSNNSQNIITPAYSSFSAPMITGIVANMIRKNPSMKFDDIKRELINESCREHFIIKRSIIDDIPHIAVIKDLTLAYNIKGYFERQGFSVCLDVDANMALKIFKCDLGITVINTDEIENQKKYDLIIRSKENLYKLEVVESQDEIVYSKVEQRKLIKRIKRILS